MLLHRCSLLAWLFIGALQHTCTAVEGSGALQPELPPVQSPGQRATFRRVAERAAVASAAATPRLEELLASAEFKAALDGCCPELDGLQPAALLELYADALAVTEVAHGFWAVGRQPGHTNQPDVDISQLADAQWFYTM